MKTLHLISLGCNKNLVDSEVMLGRLKDYALVDNPRDASVIIVNTCGFIQAAKEESIARILEVAAIKPLDSVLVVSGCLSERYASELRSEIKEIDIITGVGDYGRIDEILAQKRGIVKNSEAFLIDSHERVITGSQIHAYIKISEGCNQQCSFCAIPHIKGRLHSRSVESCVKEVEILVKRGFSDFSLIAQDSSSYMRDLGKNDALIELMSAIEGISGVKSARILYLYPSTTSHALLRKIADSRVFQNYFDMPIQHISSAVLKSMRRGATRARHIKILREMREIPHSFIRTSFIVGHPGESEEDFSELLGFLENFAFDRANIFAFSAESGTAAANMPHKIPKRTINRRISALNKLIKIQQNASFQGLVGKRIPAIIDGISAHSDFLYSARDMRWDREIDGEILIGENLSDTPLRAGHYEVEITQFKGGYLLGKAIKRL